MKAKDFEIYNTLVISTAHLPQELSGKMDREEDLFGRNGNKFEEVVYTNGDYGCRVWVRGIEEGEEFEDYYPEEMVPVIKAAKELGCRWVEFDCDADIRDEFKEYEW